VIIEPVVTTFIDSSLNYVGFQGDFTFDSAVVTFSNPPIQKAGLTSGNWNVAAGILNSGPGTIRTLRISAFSNDFVPLSGSGTLFEMRMLRVSNTEGETSPLVWAADPDNFFFIDDNLDAHVPDQFDGLLTITGPTPPGAGTFGSWALAPVTSANGVVYAASMAHQSPTADQMFALDGKTGEILWRFSTADAASPTGHSVNAGPAVVDGTVYWGSGYGRSTEGNANNKFYAFSIDGA